jgi:hypothetical protein
VSEQHEEQELREAFSVERDQLRASGRIPDFDAMMVRARADAASQGVGIDGVDQLASRRRLFRTGGWMTLATAAAATGLMFLVSPGSTSEADAEFERLVASYASTSASGTFNSPTSGLLEIPGLDLGAVPSVGDALRGFDPTATRPDQQIEGRDS